MKKNKGFFLISRSIFDSDIWFRSPEYLKAWIYLLGKANHEDKRYNGYLCKRGQTLITYKELAEQVRYRVGFRKTALHEKRMKDLMKYLMNERMIVLSRVPRGMLVTVLNYDKYQGFENYESANERTNESLTNVPRSSKSGLSINNTLKYTKNTKDIPTDFFSTVKTENEKLYEVLKNFETFRKEIKKPISSQQSATMIINKLKKHPTETAIKMVNQSIERGWQGIFELKGQFTTPNYTGADERTARLIAEVPGPIPEHLQMKNEDLSNDPIAQKRAKLLPKLLRGEITREELQNELNS